MYIDYLIFIYFNNKFHNFLKISELHYYKYNHTSLGAMKLDKR